MPRNQQILLDNRPQGEASTSNFKLVSTDTPAQTKAHNAKGHRTFRVKTADQPLLKGEIECPADSRGMTCTECGLCAGQGQPGPSIAINVHGSLAGRYLKKYGRAA